MRGYLLDTNIVRYWFDSTTPEHAPVARRLEQLPDATPITVSVITLGEFEYGRRVAPRDRTDDLAAFGEFLRSQFPQPLEIGRATTEYYGQLRAILFDRFAPKARHSGLRPEQLLAPLTARELGIQENDLWIAAQAVERNLVLVTHDKATRIREAGGDLLQIEDWAP